MSTLIIYLALDMCPCLFNCVTDNHLVIYNDTKPFINVYCFSIHDNGLQRKGLVDYTSNGPEVVLVSL